MPYAKFLKKHGQYKPGQLVDLPGRLTWRLEAEGVVIRVKKMPGMEQAKALVAIAKASKKPAAKK